MSNKPVATVNLFDPLKSKLCELYENECIFDKFSISSSPDSNYFLTGNFNSNYHLVDREGKYNNMFDLSFSKKTIVR